MEKNELTYVKGNAWSKTNKSDMKNIFKFADSYIDFLGKGVTERLCVNEAIEQAVKNGYIDINEVIKKGEKIKPGTKIYANNRGKTLALFVMGEEDLDNGFNVVGAHVDVPRLDLKPNPLYEDSDIAYLKTHYYGGVIKYQWVSIPLAMTGVIYTKNNEMIDINIGFKDDEPVFFIADLLPHLALDQRKKKYDEIIQGEMLNVIVGGIPLDDKDAKNKVKENVLEHLNKKYGIVEKDFLSAEIQIVPAMKPRYVGLDKSFIAGFGHDDRVCSFTALKAILDIEGVPRKTAISLLVDKEEVGSNGNTGMHSRYFENMISELINIQKTQYNDIYVRRAFSNAQVLSADVAAAYDSNFASAFEKTNSAFAGHGISVSKYTGSRGKSGCNDANSEFNRHILDIFEEAGVNYQTGELGKIDQGGGGTIAYILANLDADVIDCGVPVLSMHSPYELISTIDLYESYKGYKAFLQNA